MSANAGARLSKHLRHLSAFAHQELSEFVDLRGWKAGAWAEHAERARDLTRPVEEWRGSPARPLNQPILADRVSTIPDERELSPILLQIDLQPGGAGIQL